MNLRPWLLSLSLVLALAGSASAGFPFGFCRWSGFGYGPGIHAYNCCPTCPAPNHHRGGWVPYGSPLLLEPTPAPLPSPVPVPQAAEPVVSPAPQAMRMQGWTANGASLR